MDWEALKGIARCSLMVGKARSRVDELSILLGNTSDLYDQSRHVFVSIYLTVPEKSDKPSVTLFPGALCQNDPQSQTNAKMKNLWGSSLSKR